MLIKIGYDIAYEVSAPTPMLLMLYVHPERMKDLRAPEHLITEPADQVESLPITSATVARRSSRRRASSGFIAIRVIEDSGLPEPVFPNAEQHPVQDLPLDVLPFLLGSRYCEVEKLNDIAWQLFGNTRLGWQRVQAVCDWVHQPRDVRLRFAREDRTALEVYQEGRGVCRDFMHLALTFCRCLNIPARYATGYLGDIGVPPVPAAMDFSAFFQVYLGGRWHAFDARHNERRIGRVAMAIRPRRRGRGADDHLRQAYPAEVRGLDG